MHEAVPSTSNKHSIWLPVVVRSKLDAALSYQTSLVRPETRFFSHSRRGSRQLWRLHDTGECLSLEQIELGFPSAHLHSPPTGSPLPSLSFCILAACTKFCKAEKKASLVTPSFLARLDLALTVHNLRLPNRRLSDCISCLSSILLVLPYSYPRLITTTRSNHFFYCFFESVVTKSKSRCLLKPYEPSRRWRRLLPSCSATTIVSLPWILRMLSLPILKDTRSDQADTV